MFAGTALSVRLFVCVGLSLFIICGPYLSVVVCVFYTYNLTPDQYPGMLDIDPELEKKFRRRRKIQVEDVPEAVMKIAEEQEAMDAVNYEHSQSQSQSQSQPPTSTFIPTAEDRKVMEEEEEEQ